MAIHLEQLHVGAGTQIGPVTTFPVWSQRGPSLSAPYPKYVNVDELDQPRIGAVNATLAIGRRPVLLTEGTLMRGGMQTRVLAHDTVLQPQQSLEVETVCVEAGRWGGGSSHIVGGRVPVRVLGQLRGVRHNGGARNDARHRQGRVWQEVDRYQDHYGQRPTSNMAELFDGDDDLPMRRRFQRLERELQAHSRAVMPGQNGIVIAVAGQPIMLEVFPSGRLLQHHLPALFKGLAMDAALFVDEPTPSRRARRFVERVMARDLDVVRDINAGAIYGTHDEYVDIRVLRSDLDDRATSAHVLAINSRHDLVLAA